MGKKDATKRVPDKPNPIKKMEKSKLFSQRKFKNALSESEHPDFDVEEIFDKNYKEGGEIKTAKKKKDKGTDKLLTSFSTKRGKISNTSYYKYDPF
jgi:hypothetical protein